MDTWLQFLTALCAPQKVAMFLKQQAVLCSLVFAGNRSAESDRAVARQNRKDLLVAMRLGEPIGMSLGPPTAGVPPPPLEQCLGHHLLTEGICDIAISWTHPEEWEVGQNVLFHGPGVMGLPSVPTPRGETDLSSRWVSLSQLVWVLQP